MATVNKNLSVYDKTVFQSETFSFGVCFEWNEAITEGLYNGAEQAFLENKVPAEHITMECSWKFRMDGCVKNASNSKRRCCNCHRCDLSRNQHFDFVCDGVAQGIKRFECSNGYSCYCVLLTTTMQQSIDRSGGIHGNKGTRLR
jgi:6,7-dimethyl-8-ribityllumazine synthase